MGIRYDRLRPCRRDARGRHESFRCLPDAPADAGHDVADDLRSRVGPFTRLALPAGFSGVIAEAVRAKMTMPANLPIVVFAPRGGPTIDSMLIAGIAGAAKDSSFPPLPPLFTARLPEWRAFVPARAPVNKTHPRDLNTPVRSESDTLEVSVIVDERGVPLLGTTHILRAPARAIAINYLDWFRETRFVPGHIQQCAVRFPGPDQGHDDDRESVHALLAPC